MVGVACRLFSLFCRKKSTNSVKEITFFVKVLTFVHFVKVLTFENLLILSGDCGKI